MALTPIYMLDEVLEWFAMDTENDGTTAANRRTVQISYARGLIIEKYPELETKVFAHQEQNFLEILFNSLNDNQLGV
jgi:hypothetical protein